MVKNQEIKNAKCTFMSIYCDLCQKENTYEYIEQIEQIVREGINKGEIKQGEPKAMASEIYGLICSTLVYKLRNQDTFDVTNIYKEFERTVIEGLKGK